MLSPMLLWILLAIVFGGWVVVSWVLTYHWKTYAKGNRVISRALKFYYTTSILLFIVVGLLITLL